MVWWNTDKHDAAKIQFVHDKLSASAAMPTYIQSHASNSKAKFPLERCLPPLQIYHMREAHDELTRLLGRDEAQALG